MTVAELYAEIKDMPSNYNVIIRPQTVCCGGIPQWKSAYAVADDNRETVKILLWDETDE